MSHLSEGAPEEAGVAVQVSRAAADAGVVIRVSRTDDQKTSMDFTKLAAIVTGIAFAIGLLFNIGYFTALDLKLFPLLSYRDHLNTLVFFAPFVIVLIFPCLGLRREPAFRKVATLTAGGLAAGTLIAWLERDAIVGFPTLSAIIAGVVFLTAFLLIVYCAAVVLENLLEMGDTQDTSRVQEMTVAGVGVILFVTLLGNVAAHSAAGGSWFDTEITLTGESGTKPERHSARLVRAIDGGLLVIFQDAPDKLAYVRSESLRMIEEPRRP